jgi:mycobactin peptide synthetase MbtE
MTIQHELMKSLRMHDSQTAIEYGQEKISYAALRDRSDRVTDFLLKQGLKRETVVGIMLQHRPDIIAAILGVINAGCVFVILDKALPNARLQNIFRDLDLQHVIASEPESGADMSAYSWTEIIRTEPEEIGYPEYKPDDSLYVYFTSGSTGMPKGIVGKNSSVRQFIHWEIEAFGLGKGIRVSQFISPYFDAFLRDIFVPLLAGGTVCIPVEEDVFTPEKMVAWINTHMINLIHCVPSLFRVFNNDSLTPQDFAALQYVLLSGEKIVPAQLGPWYNTFGTRIQLVNLYGATETTMIRAYYRIVPEDATSARIPIGFPISDTALLVLDKDLKPCNMLVPGDLYIASEYVTKGYLNNPQLTHDRFVNIKTGGHAEIAFKTGDTARRLPDGKIDLIGRTDRQVKLRGIRIEPGEIEAALVKVAGVKDAVVIKQEDDTGTESLIAFVIAYEPAPGALPLQDTIQQHMQAHLPAYSIPSAVIEVHEYPLLTNGKIDYSALLNRKDAEVIVAPVNSVEKRLLAIWKEILGDKTISTDSNFHAIGGTSLSIMRLIGKIYKEYNIRVSLSQLFDNLTIKEQAALIGRAGRENLMTISRTPVKPAYNLSAAQERIYFNYELDKGSTAYNLPMAWEITGRYDRGRIETVFQALTERHETFRTEFKFENGKILQVVKDAVDFHLDEVKIQDPDIRKAIRGLIKPFDLSRAPLLTAVVIVTPDGRRVLLVNTHHIVCDGMSQINLFAEFLSLYQGETLLPLALQYKDYAEWEVQFRTESQYLLLREFWLKSFEAEVPKLALPTLHAELGQVSDEGSHATFSVDRKTLDPLVNTFKASNITAFSTLFSINFVFLYSLTAQEDIVVGINTSGRMQEDLQDVVGMFAKTLPIRYTLDPRMSFREVVKNIHTYLVHANSNQIYDLANIMAELNKGKTASVKSLFDVVFVFLNFEEKKMTFGDTVFTGFEFENITARYPITVLVTEDAVSYNFRLQYSLDYFTEGDIDMLIGQFQSLVKTLVANPDITVMESIDTSKQGALLAEDDIQFNF